MLHSCIPSPTITDLLQALTPNDTVVFEVVSSTDAKYVRVHIFR